MLKPAPINPQDIYLASLEAIGFDLSVHDIRFVEDDWENPSLGAAGLGWEIWCDGMEITQYTYFQQIGGIPCSVPPVEITYGLERIAAFIQNVESHFEIAWNNASGPRKKTYGDIFRRFEREFSFYNFDYANIDTLLQHFEDYEEECERLLTRNMVMPAYEQCVKANHCFNLLTARGVVSVTERASYIFRIRTLAHKCCTLWLESL
jgi:glycyl-tRNA synthetase alpha chain